MPKASDHNPLTLKTLFTQLENLTDLEIDPVLQLVELKTGEVLFDEGEAGDSMYLLLAGVLGVRMKQADGSEAVIDKLAPGATVGEMALLSGRPRTATVFAINDAGLIRLNRSKFESLSREERHNLIDLDRTVAARWQRVQLAKILPTLFGELNANELHQIQSNLTWRHLSNGDVLFSQGDAADGMMIVVNGRLRIQAKIENTLHIISEITAGDIVGEWGVISDEPRAASVVAVRETNIVHLSKPFCEQLTRQKPEWMQRLTHLIVDRQRALQEPSTRRLAPSNLAIIPTSPDIDVALFAGQLTASMAPFGQTLLLDSTQFDKQYGKEGAAQTAPGAPDYPAITAWISEQETNYAQLLFVADAELTGWTRRCINQADRILLLADPNSDPTPGPVERQIAQLKTPLRTELVLWHPATTSVPKKTAVWLQPRTVAHHYHVRQGDTAHMDRLARRLTGNGIGLVLSGGAALGCAHQGVYKAILELDIPLDYIAGASMGAIMGGAMAVEMTYEQFSQQMRLSAELGILDYTLPLASLARSKNVKQILTTAFGAYQIEDLWIPFFCVSSNLSTAEPVVHQRGSMWRAIRASMSIPGVFLPLVEDGEVLVDGGIMDNFPAERLRDLIESDRTMGVVLAPFKAKTRQYDYDTDLSGWQVLWHRINPFNKRLRLPTPADTLIWAMEINGRRASRDQETAVDLLISPDVKAFNVTDYDRWEELADAGYQAALDPLTSWKNEKLPFLSAQKQNPSG